MLIILAVDYVAYKYNTYAFSHSASFGQVDLQTLALNIKKRFNQPSPIICFLTLIKNKFKKLSGLGKNESIFIPSLMDTF